MPIGETWPVERGNPSHREHSRGGKDSRQAKKSGEYVQKHRRSPSRTEGRMEEKRRRKEEEKESRPRKSVGTCARAALVSPRGPGTLLYDHHWQSP